MQSLIDKLKTGDGAVTAMLWIGIGLVLLIVVVVFAAWLIRVLRPTLNMSGAPARAGRVQRLAVTDAFPLDRDGRKLVIVRRDNVEHLLLIGGPNDVLVEANFMRSDRARGARQDGSTDVTEAGLDAAIMVPPTGQRPQAPASVSVPPPASPPAPAMRQAPPQRPPVITPAPAPPSAPPKPRPEPKPEPMVEQPQAPTGRTEAAPKASEFDLEFEQAMRAIEAPAPVPSRVAAPQSAPVQQARPPVPSAAPRAEPNIARSEPSNSRSEPSNSRSEPMSEMARRLSEVLQKPVSPQRTPAPPAQPRPPMPPVMQPVAPATTAPTPPGPAKPATEVEMDLLEEEMARLLGRPVTPVKPGGA